jgi:hypothetical protein
MGAFSKLCSARATNCAIFSRNFFSIIAKHRSELAARLFTNYESVTDFALAYRSHSAIEPSLPVVSPENGHNAKYAQRFSAIERDKYRIWHAETVRLRQEARKRRASCDISAKISRARTGWLTTLDSNCGIPILNFLFEFSGEFRGISGKNRGRDFSRQA